MVLLPHTAVLVEYVCVWAHMCREWMGADFCVWIMVMVSVSYALDTRQLVATVGSQEACVYACVCVYTHVCTV